MYMEGLFLLDVFTFNFNFTKLIIPYAVLRVTIESPGFIFFTQDLTTVLVPVVALGMKAKSVGSQSEENKNMWCLNESSEGFIFHNNPQT